MKLFFFGFEILSFRFSKRRRWKLSLTKMASLKEDNIDFNKLENGAQSAMDAENLYWLRNDAKFRAVKQKGTYDEFKEIVAAAHLKPLEKGDKLQLDEKIVSPWNPTAHSMLEKPAAVNSGTISDSPLIEALPHNSQAFIRTWRSLISDEERFHFLLRNSEVDNLIAIFQTEVPSDLLGQFLLLLSNGYSSALSTEIHKVLNDFTKLGRFEMGLLFMSQAEKDAVRHLLNKLKEEGGVDCRNLFDAYKVK